MSYGENSTNHFKPRTMRRTLIGEKGKGIGTRFFFQRNTPKKKTSFTFPLVCGELCCSVLWSCYMPALLLLKFDPLGPLVSREQQRWVPFQQPPHRWRENATVFFNVFSFLMGVSINGGTPKSFFRGLSLINHLFWGTSIYGNPTYYSNKDP